MLKEKSAQREVLRERFSERSSQGGVLREEGQKEVECRSEAEQDQRLYTPKRIGPEAGGIQRR